MHFYFLCQYMESFAFLLSFKEGGAIAPPLNPPLFIGQIQVINYVNDAIQLFARE